MPMICPRCGVESAPRARFCHNCGLRLATATEQDRETHPASVSKKKAEEEETKETHGKDEKEEGAHQERHTKSEKEATEQGSSVSWQYGEHEMKHGRSTEEKIAEEETHAEKAHESKTESAREEEALHGSGGGARFSPEENEDERNKKERKIQGEPSRKKVYEEDELIIQEILRPIAAVILIIVIIFLLTRGNTGGTTVHNPSSAIAVNASTSTSTSTTSILAHLYNSPGGIKPYLGDVEYVSSTVLTGNLVVSNSIFIDPQVTVTTNGYSIIAKGDFENFGQVMTGTPGDDAALGSPGRSYSFSYGGSGGTGGGTPYPQNGSEASAPNLTNARIQQWYSDGMKNYLTGAGGGGGCTLHGLAGNGGNTTIQGGAYSGYLGNCTYAGGRGGSGAYGVYIQAYSINAGIINANGRSGMAGTVDGGGGGGGGMILLAYGKGGFTPGSYSMKGGIIQQNSGGGGNGQLAIYDYGTNPPITVPS